MWFRRKIQSGKKLGRKIGFPTLNLNVGSFKNYCSPGVYACQVVVKNKIYKGAMHFGPVLNRKTLKLEIHVLNFNQNIYGQWVKFKVLKKIREPMRFTDLNKLKKQIQKDLKRI